jgi:hypothetical protein
MNKIKVLFIGGYGRSGSTLLDCMLGQMDGFFSAGELRHIWVRSFRENQLCGCGRPFKQCPFWKAVLEEAFGGIHNLDLEEVQALRNSVDRVRCIPALALSALQSREYQEKLKQYTTILERLYGAIQKVSGCKVIIDSSKDPIQGFILNTIPNIDLRIVHLIRDSRAVAYSWQKKKRRPEIFWKEEYIPRYSSVKSTQDWMRKNLMVEALGFLCHHVMRVRYEDLVKDPQSVLSQTAASLAEVEPKTDFLEGQFVNLQVNHTVAGNPFRFKTGAIEIQNDNEWETKMDKRQHLFVTILTAPLLLGYGYARS